MPGETILVVDDTPDNRQFVMKYVLAPNDYQGIEAGNGEEGLKIALNQPIDLILLDYNMPVMDGRAMLEAMNEHGLDVPVILMTFHGSEDIAIEVFRLGVRDYVTKPFYPEDMEILIDKHLSEVRLRKETEALTSRVLKANQTLKARLEELNMLYRIGKHVTSLSDIQLLLARVVSAAVAITRSDQGVLYIVQNQMLYARAEQKPGQEAETTDYECTDETALAVWQRAEPDSDQPAMLYTPMIAGGRVLGVIGIQRTPGQADYQTHQEILLGALSDYAAIAITNARNYEARKRLKTITQEIAPFSVRRPISVIAIRLRLPNNTDLTKVNDLMKQLTDTISRYDGHLDGMYNQTLITLFNITSQDDHPVRAATVALKLSAQFADALSVGISAGMATVGTVDMPSQRQVKAVSSAIDVALHLAERGALGQVLMDGVMVKGIGPKRVTQRVLGAIRLPGRKQPVTVHMLKRLTN
jgi:DNA-binding response OmpR family regulator